MSYPSSFTSVTSYCASASGGMICRACSAMQPIPAALAQRYLLLADPPKLAPGLADLSGGVAASMSSTGVGNSQRLPVLSSNLVTFSHHNSLARGLSGDSSSSNSLAPFSMSEPLNPSGGMAQASYGPLSTLTPTFNTFPTPEAQPLSCSVGSLSGGPVIAPPLQSQTSFPSPFLVTDSSPGHQ